MSNQLITVYVLFYSWFRIKWCQKQHQWNLNMLIKHNGALHITEIHKECLAIKLIQQHFPTWHNNLK